MCIYRSVDKEVFFPLKRKHLGEDRINKLQHGSEEIAQNTTQRDKARKIFNRSEDTGGKNEQVFIEKIFKNE